MKIHNFSVCDLVRREDNGKFLLVGVYSNEIIFSSLPAKFPFTLWFLAEHEALGLDEIALRARTSVDDAPFFTMEGQVEVADVSTWSPIAASLVADFREPCTLFLEAKINGEDWIVLRETRVKVGDVLPPLPPSPLPKMES
ncbi:hypothetical protein [Rhizobium sp. K102]|uniref:hypothetical protein n=1 Tax=Rhizobium sp. K102 TaxID=2918527 RepID=UPI001EFA769E|nr:hypothetical protein [Rhizobium sp. K102]ULR43162.1 hypothetical protein MHI61_18250 [Rhizobium sp. K102]